MSKKIRRPTVSGKTWQSLVREIEQLKADLEEAKETIEYLKLNEVKTGWSDPKCKHWGCVSAGTVGYCSDDENCDEFEPKDAEPKKGELRILNDIHVKHLQIKEGGMVQISNTGKYDGLWRITQITDKEIIGEEIPLTINIEANYKKRMMAKK